MKKLLAALCLICPIVAKAGLITHEFDVRLLDYDTNELVNTASITLDADPRTWTLRQAWIHIDGKTVASDQTERLGKDHWRYYEPAHVWKAGPLYYSFTDGDWTFMWSDWPTEIAVPYDENPIYSYVGRDAFTYWEWFIRDSGVWTSGGSMWVTSYNGWTYKVPEPATYVLLGLGLIAMGWRRRSI